VLWSFEQLTIGNADEAAETFAKRVTTQPREMAALVSFDPAALSARVRVSRAPTARTRDRAKTRALTAASVLP